MTTETSPRPWRVKPCGRIRDAEGAIVAECASESISELIAAQANSFDAMWDALIIAKRQLDYCSGEGYCTSEGLDAINAALSLTTPPGAAR